jgi:hypothetical protein
MTRQDKREALLRSRIRMAQDDANDLLDARAVEIARECPGVPLAVIRGQLAQNLCPCAAATKLMDKMGD